MIRVSTRRCGNVAGRAEKFAEKFRPLLENSQTLTADAVLDALQELESIYEPLGRVGSYAGLLYAADTARPEYQDLEQQVEQRSTEIRNLLLFFELEWLKLDDALANRIMADPSAQALQPLSREPTPLPPAYALANRKRKFSMNETTPVATPSAASFPSSPRRFHFPSKGTAKRNNST